MRVVSQKGAQAFRPEMSWQGTFCDSRWTAMCELLIWQGPVVLDRLCALFAGGKPAARLQMTR